MAKLTDIFFCEFLVTSGPKSRELYKFILFMKIRILKRMNIERFAL